MVGSVKKSKVLHYKRAEIVKIQKKADKAKFLSGRFDLKGVEGGFNNPLKRKNGSSITKKGMPIKFLRC